MQWYARELPPPEAGYWELETSELEDAFCHVLEAYYMLSHQDRRRRRQREAWANPWRVLPLTDWLQLAHLAFPLIPLEGAERHGAWSWVWTLRWTAAQGERTLLRWRDQPEVYAAERALFALAEDSLIVAAKARLKRSGTYLPLDELRLTEEGARAYAERWQIDRAAVAAVLGASPAPLAREAAGAALGAPLADRGPAPDSVHRLV